MTDIANLLREAAEEIEMSRGYCDFADELRAAAESLGEPVAWRAVGPSYTVVVTDPERATDSRWEPLYLAPPAPALPDALQIEGAIGGAYEMLDGRQFWIDTAVAQEITRRVLAAAGDSHHE